MQFAVDFVGAALGDGVEHGAGGVAHGGVEARSLHLEFRDGILRQLEGNQRIAAPIKEGVRNAIDGVFVGVKRVAVSGELRGGAVEGALPLAKVGGIDHSRRQEHEFIRVTGLQG